MAISKGFHTRLVVMSRLPLLRFVVSILILPVISLITPLSCWESPIQLYRETFVKKFDRQCFSAPCSRTIFQIELVRSRRVSSFRSMWPKFFWDQSKKQQRIRGDSHLFANSAPSRDGSQKPPLLGRPTSFKLIKQRSNAGSLKWNWLWSMVGFSWI